MSIFQYYEFVYLCNTSASNCQWEFRGQLNMPGAINHVITRGLNRQNIFLDDCDQNDFLVDLKKSFFDWLQALAIRTSNRSPGKPSLVVEA